MAVPPELLVMRPATPLDPVLVTIGLDWRNATSRLPGSVNEKLALSRASPGAQAAISVLPAVHSGFDATASTSAIVLVWNVSSPSAPP
jgi:hypothetical protein